MNFFKKVMTFFSTIWNALLWRKPDKKARKPAHSEQQDLTGNDSHLISETEKLFVDVPLHPEEASGWSEQELSAGDDIPDILIPIVALNIEPAVADNGIQRNLSQTKISGFEDEACGSLTRVCEPVPAVGAKSPDTQPLLTTPENNFLHAEGKIGQLDELIPKKYPISLNRRTRDDSHDQNIVAELRDSALEVHSTSGNFPCSTSEGIEPITPLQSAFLLNKNNSVESLISSTDCIAAHMKCRINPDLNVLSVCDEMHLFDHEGTTFNCAEEDELKGTVETLVEDESTSPQKSLMFHTSSAEDVMINENATNSRCEAAIFLRASISSTQSTPESNTQDLDGTYSTNYMVKSDSLVNFLPEDRNHHNMKDISDILESPNNLKAHEEGVLLKEDCLEEIMCTPRGILKLSGDHVVDDTDDKDSFQILMNTAIEKVMNDDEPQLRTHHLEGYKLEEDPLQSNNDEPSFQKILNDVEIDLDSEPVTSLASMTHDVESQPVSIGRCRSIIRNDPKSQTNARHHEIELKDHQHLDEYEDSKTSKGSCRLSEFIALHLDGSDKMGPVKRNDLLSPEVLSMSFGESPKRNGPIDFDPQGRDKGSSSFALKDQLDSTNQLPTDSPNKVLLASPSWQLTVPSFIDSEEDSKTVSYQSNTHLFLGSPSPMFGIDDKSSRDPTEVSLQTEIDEDINTFHPFIECSHLLRIPKEIRKETSFNPCVGAAPSQRSCYKFIPDVETEMYDDKDAGYESKYSTLRSMRSDFDEPVLSVSSSLHTEYKTPQTSNLPDRYRIGSWGPFPNVIHPVNQQQATVGYPMSCESNYYEEGDLNVMSTVTYDNDQTNICTNPEGYGFVNSYGAVEFPILRIPLCVPQPQPTFMATGTLEPTIFPLDPFNIEANENPMNLEASMHNEQYSTPNIWRGYSANAHLMNEEDGEITSMAEGRALAPITEDGSCTGTNYEEDDHDDNPISDPYFQSLADNNSLHTVKSKADSYSGSLFCESLRSLISHTTENDNVFQSFSCSSVQGCCPSVVVQSCETTLSNDSLPSIIVEETKYSKSVDEDYLATEKFMNDVNSALNESVLDQIQCRLDLHSNLLGRGDCSLPGSLNGSEHHVEIPENDLMLRNSLGENISINNSKLTLLDGVLGGGSQQDAVQNLGSLDHGRSSTTACCREMLESLIENVITSLNGESSTDGCQSALGGVADTDCRENHDATLLENRETDFIIQNMMFIEGVPDQVREMWNKGLRTKQENLMNKAVSGIPSENKERGLEASETVVDSFQAIPANDVPSRKGRRNRRRKKKSNFDSEFESEACAEVAGSTGDGKAQQSLPIEPSLDTMGETSMASKPVEIQAESDISKSDGEQLGSTRENSKCEQSLAQIENASDDLDEDDKPADSSNTSNCKRGRNRRRKRKN